MGRILLCDDEESLCRSLGRILRAAGHEVVTQNGEEGLSRLRQERFDLILTDIRMPVMDGIALALAAACAAKAVSISQKHSSDQALLMVAHTRLDTVRDFAMQGADIDALAFTQFIRNQTTASATNLVETGQRMEWLIKLLFSIIEEVEPFVSQTVVGDLVAARALGAAARTIQSANETEATTAAERLAGERSAKPGTPPATTA